MPDHPNHHFTYLVTKVKLLEYLFILKSSVGPIY